MIVSDSVKDIFALWIKTGVINGCGQKWKISFSQLFSALENVDNFIPEKGKICFKEIEYGCGIHDILCEFWGTRSMKLFADLWFASYVKDRIIWTGFFFRNIFFWWLFLGLHFSGKDAGNFTK